MTKYLELDGFVPVMVASGIRSGLSETTKKRLRTDAEFDRHFSATYVAFARLGLAVMSRMNTLKKDIGDNAFTDPEFKPDTFGDARILKEYYCLNDIMTRAVNAGGSTGTNARIYCSVAAYGQFKEFTYGAGHTVTVTGLMGTCSVIGLFVLATYEALAKQKKAGKISKVHETILGYVSKIIEEDADSDAK